MFTTDFKKALSSKSKPFLARSTCGVVSKMPIETQKQRFDLLVELCTYNRQAGGYFPLPKPGGPVPDLAKISTILAELGTAAFNQAIFFHCVDRLIGELSGEFNDLSNGEPNFSVLPDYVDGNAELEDFCAITNDVNIHNKVYTFVGKSGKTYSGKGVKDLSKLKGPEVEDVIDGCDDNMAKWASAHKEDLKSEFKNVRMCLISVLSAVMFPEGNESKIAKYVKKRLEEEAR